jgi:aldehyde dehydrogenase (NAD+)
LISASQRAAVAGAVDRARQEGGEIVVGGGMAEVDGCPGHFYLPTIVRASPDSALAQEEVFGPVLSVMTAADLDEAIEIANNSRYGLVAGIYTRSIDKALRFSRDVEASQVFLNRYLAGGVETPVGGMRDSGIGREKGLRGLSNYLRTKCTTFPICE